MLLLIKIMRDLILNSAFLSSVYSFFKNAVMLMLNVSLIYNSIILKSILYIIINKHKSKFKVFIYKLFL